jgi:hypothetical protein
MTAWGLFIFVAGPCFVSLMLCPNHRHLRYNILFVSSELCTLIQSFYHFIIISSHLHISSTLGHSTKAIHTVCNYSRSKRVSDINGGRQDCCAASDQTISVLTLSSPARRPRATRLDRDLHS